MRSGNTAPIAIDDGMGSLQAFARRQMARLTGLALLAIVACALAALGTWNVEDPSFSHATANAVTNAAGYPGAVFSDLAIQFFGLAAVPALVPLTVWALLLLAARRIGHPGRRGFAWFGGAVLAAGVVGCISAPPTWPLPSGLGGVVGDLVLALPAALTGGYPHGWLGGIIAIVLSLPALWLLLYAAALRGRDGAPLLARREQVAAHEPQDFTDEDEEKTKSGPRACWRLARSPTGGCRRAPSCAAVSAAPGPPPSAGVPPR